MGLPPTAETLERQSRIGQVPLLLLRCKDTKKRTKMQIKRPLFLFFIHKKPPYIYYIRSKREIKYLQQQKIMKCIKNMIQINSSSFGFLSFASIRGVGIRSRASNGILSRGHKNRDFEICSQSP